MKKKLRICSLIIFAVIFAAALSVIFPQIGIKGAKRGMVICADVIIPSLFPFTVFVLFIINSGVLDKLKFTEKITIKVFHQSYEMFSVMLMSFVGGYPVGARLINELYRQEKIDKKTSHLMQCYCVNAGPAFIVTAVGVGMFSSESVGYALLSAHLISSFILAIVFGRMIKPQNVVFKQSKAADITENFISSTSAASSSVLGICAFVILFSMINSYIEAFCVKFKSFKILMYLTEVTSGVAMTDNIIFAAFILGFSGFCIWMQVLSSSNDCGINIFLFSLSRLLHGLISSLIVFLIIKFFNIDVSTISNFRFVNYSAVYKTVSLSVSMAIMLLLLFAKVKSKKYSGNLLKDMI